MIYKLRRMDEHESSYNDIIGRYPQLINYYIEEYNEDYFDEYGDQQTHSYCTINIETIEEVLRLAADTNCSVMVSERQDWETEQQPFTHTLMIVDDYSWDY